MSPLTWFTGRAAGVPRWVWLHLVLVVAATAAGAYAGWAGRPDILFGDFDDTTLGEPLRFLTDLWASKNVAYLAVIAGVVALRTPVALGAILGMKFVNDSLDQLYFGPRHLPDADLAANLAPWLIMTAPMGVAAWVLFVRPAREGS